MIVKLISFSVVIGLIYGSVKKTGYQIEFVTNFVKIVGVSIEVRNIEKKVYIDYGINRHGLRTLSKDVFRKYLRAEFKSLDTDRDTSKDLWLTPYRLTVVGNDRFEIRSAGPDRRFRTDDDIVAGGKCR